MPFGSYEASNEHAVANAQRFVKEAGCEAVKLERGGASVGTRPGRPSLTASQPASLTKRCAFATACSFDCS